MKTYISGLGKVHGSRVIERLSLQNAQYVGPESIPSCAGSEGVRVVWLYMPPWYFIEEEAEGASHDWLALQQGLLGLRRNSR